MDIFEQKPKGYTWLYVGLVFICFFIILGVIGYRMLTSLTPADLLGSSFVQNQITSQLEKKNETAAYSAFVPFLTQLLGFTEPATYLLLFQNNTELRPGGGFIGSYAVVEIKNGEPTILEIAGTEKLGNQTPSDWKPVPPAIITKELGVDRWFFRDSNWSPDYKENVQRGLTFYEGQGGNFVEDIDHVVAITPVVLEEIIKLTGPIVVDGIEFTSENVTEKLEYEVEFGYAKRGIPVENRKQILEPFFKVIIDQLKDRALTNISSYLPTLTTLLNEKHMVFYSKKDLLQKMFETNNWAGRVREHSGDHFQWIDANLAALKTDHAIKRNISYKILPQEDENYLSTVSMKYQHKGTFDFRTSRYRTYARVFVPEGAVLQSVEGSDISIVDQGVENGRTWFGMFVVVEPGTEKTVSFSYLLPGFVKQTILKGQYTLNVQKQLGTIEPTLTLDLHFDKTLTAAKPAEDRSKWGDNRYQMETNLRIDRGFAVSLK